MATTATSTPPIPTRRLLLCVRFSLADGDHQPLGDAHAEAVRRACVESGLMRPEDVTASAVVVASPGFSIERAQDVPYDAALLGDKAAAITYVYTDDAMVVRVVVSLAKVDGVTALRVGLHALELVAGGAMSNPSEFASPPTYTYGSKQMINFGRMLARTLGKIAGAKLLGFLFDKAGAAKRIGAPEGTIVPTTATSMLAYYAAHKTPPPASYRLFAATE